MGEGILSGALPQDMGADAPPRVMINGIPYERSPQSNFQVEGSGGYGRGLLEGGGRLGYQIPMNSRESLIPYLAGGGILGSMSTPYGDQRIKQGGATIGVNYKRAF